MPPGAPVESRTRHLEEVALNPAALTGEGIGQTQKPHPRPALLHVALSGGTGGTGGLLRPWGPGARESGGPARPGPRCFQCRAFLGTTTILTR